MLEQQLAIINQKNRIASLEGWITKNPDAHPHDKIEARMKIIIERVKLGLLITSNK